MIQNLSARLQTLFVLIGLVILFGIPSPRFLSTDNLLNVMQQSAINAILGIGLTFVIISAGIDLSVGSILALCGRSLLGVPCDEMDFPGGFYVFDDAPVLR